MKVLIVGFLVWLELGSYCCLNLSVVLCFSCCPNEDGRVTNSLKAWHWWIINHPLLEWWPTNSLKVFIEKASNCELKRISIVMNHRTIDYKKTKNKQKTTTLFYYWPARRKYVSQCEFIFSRLVQKPEMIYVAKETMHNEHLVGSIHSNLPVPEHSSGKARLSRLFLQKQ